ncbi:MAG: hypothetical protein ACUVX8_12865 [Candidatus Zipacnadales bacterium]
MDPTASITQPLCLVCRPTAMYCQGERRSGDAVLELLPLQPYGWLVVVSGQLVGAILDRTRLPNAEESTFLE